MFLRRHPRLGTRLLVVGTLLGYLFGIPLTANLLSRSLQSYPPLPEQLPSLTQAGAIVVLGGGLHKDAPEYGDGPTVNDYTLQRVRYAARLAWLTGLPVLAAGGYREPVDSPSEAELMRDILEKELGYGPVLTETASQNTWENAMNSAALLRERRIDTILLVTNAVHLPRAVTAFQAQGLKVIPAPTLFFDDRIDPADPKSWLPSVAASAEIHYVCYEWLGRLWYIARYRAAP